MSTRLRRVRGDILAIDGACQCTRFDLSILVCCVCGSPYLWDVATIECKCGHIREAGLTKTWEPLTRFEHEEVI